MGVSLRSQRLWQDFLVRIHRAVDRVGTRLNSDPVKSEEEPWFRGMTSMRHELMPSLFRRFEEPNQWANEGPNQWRRVRDVECDLFFEFATRARELHGENMSDWDILFAMQHHGTPTRLLDWTESLGVALYFATLQITGEVVQAVEAQAMGTVTPQQEALIKNTSVPCVWVLNPYALTELSWESREIIDPSFLGWESDEDDDAPEAGEYWSYGEIVADGHDFGWKWPVAIYPRQKTARMHAQRAWFTFHGDEHLTLDDVQRTARAKQRTAVSKSDRKGRPVKMKSPFLLRVRLPLGATPSALLFLEHAGINHYSLFPELPGLSRWLLQKYRMDGNAKHPAPVLSKTVSKNGKMNIPKGKRKRRRKK